MTIKTIKKASWWRLLCACYYGTIAKIDKRKIRNCKNHTWVENFHQYQLELECELCGCYYTDWVKQNGTNFS
jgi:hypothetical protein